MKLSEFDKGRIEGALVFWQHMADTTRDPVPSVDRMLNLPKGTTQKYLKSKEAK